METLRRVLIWETIGYEPTILFNLICVSKNMSAVLSSDLSYIHYFVESFWDIEDIRKLSFQQACNQLKKQITEVPPVLPFFIPETKNIAIYNCKTYSTTVYQIPELEGTFFWYLKWVFLTVDCIWWLDVHGVYNPNQGLISEKSEKVWSYNFDKQDLKRQADMQEARVYSGIVAINRFIYVFGANYIKTAEMYNGKGWSYIPDLPFGSYGLMCVEYKRDIMLYDETEYNFYKFSPKTQAYTEVQVNYDPQPYIKLAKYGDNLLLLGTHGSYEIKGDGIILRELCGSNDDIWTGDSFSVVLGTRIYNYNQSGQVYIVDVENNNSEYGPNLRAATFEPQSS